jgi:hypothetical protein
MFYRICKNCVRTRLIICLSPALKSITHADAFQNRSRLKSNVDYKNVLNYSDRCIILVNRNRSFRGHRSNSVRTAADRKYGRTNHESYKYVPNCTFKFSSLKVPFQTANTDKGRILLNMTKCSTTHLEKLIVTQLINFPCFM